MGYFISKLRSITYLNQAGKTANKMFIIPNNYLNTLYQIAWAYVVLDVIYKANKVKSHGPQVVGLSCLDTTVWHLLASFAIPTVILNVVINGSNQLLSVGGRYTNKFTMITPIVLGLATLPFIVEPVDSFTSFTLNCTIRKFYIDKLDFKEMKDGKELNELKREKRM